MRSVVTLQYPNVVSSGTGRSEIEVRAGIQAEVDVFFIHVWFYCKILCTINDTNGIENNYMDCYFLVFWIFVVLLLGGFHNDVASFTTQTWCNFLPVWICRMKNDGKRLLKFSYTTFSGVFWKVSKVVESLKKRPRS